MNIKEVLKKSSIIEALYKNFIKFLSKMSPMVASKVKYFMSFGKRLNLENPETFNEKLMWIKLFEEDSVKAMCTDKYEVRKYVKNQGLEEILIDLYYVYDKVEEIKFDELPNSFVLKCTHGCGCNVFCPDKSKLDKEEAITILEKWMATDYSLLSAEPHYSKIKPRIVAEQYIGTENGILPIDYKFHCFHGEPQLIEVVLDRTYNEKKLIFLDRSWNVLPYNNDSMNIKADIERPNKIDEMYEIARVLSEDFTYVRVDLYYQRGKIYFGELTFTPAACCHTHLFKDADYEIGRLLDLNKSSVKQFNI